MKFVCNLCSEEFSTEEELEQHMREEHNTEFLEYLETENEASILEWAMSDEAGQDVLDYIEQCLYSKYLGDYLEAMDEKFFSEFVKQWSEEVSNGDE